MNIQILSDIHTEFYPSIEAVEQLCDKLICKDADILLICGDLGTSKDRSTGMYSINGDEVLDTPIILTATALDKFCRAYNEVLWVPGNHEYYYNTISGTKAWMTLLEEKINNLTILDDVIWVRDNVRIIGSTLWFATDPHNAFHWRSMNDSRFNKLQDMETLGEKAHKFIVTAAQEAKDDETLIIATHMAPHNNSIIPGYRKSTLNRFYVHQRTLNELCHKDAMPDVWVHGHIHLSSNYVIDNTHILSNPLGYPHEFNPNFKNGLILRTE